MNKVIFLLLICCFLGKQVNGQCAENSQPKVLLVGDSWAFFMNTDATINSVFKTWGHSNYKFVSKNILAENGANTKDFIKADKQAEIINQLNLNPSIEVVHLSIGGNDFLGDWKVSFSQGRTDSLKAEVFERLDSIIRFIKSAKPGIRILWSGYVYPNFGEVIGNSTGHPYYSAWSKMELPTFIQLNTLLNDVSAEVETYAAADPQVDFIKCTGLLQYIYGQTTPLGVPPGGSFAPYSVPLPLGDPNYPSNKSAMLDLIFTKDCFHLSAQAYKDFIGYHTQKFYHKFLMDDLYLLSNNNTETGSVSSTGGISARPYLGTTSGEQFATVLSFNTTFMADTTLKKASIFLRRKALTGTNPINGSLEVKVKSGNFGTTVDIEAADFSAAGDANGTPCLFGSNTANGDWIRLDLPAAVISQITHNANTQFIISSSSATGRVEFYDSSDPDFAPVLNLVYGGNPSGINETASNKEFSIYPNPTTGKLTINGGTEKITHIAVSNLLGEIVLHPKVQQNTIDISSLIPGMYILNITTPDGKISQRIVKN